MFPLLRAFILEPALVILTHSRRKSSKLRGKKNRGSDSSSRDHLLSKEDKYMVNIKRQGTRLNFRIDHIWKK